MTDVSVIIVSFNTKNLLEKCIDSVIKKTQDISFEIIVIDNGSSDGSPQAVRKKNINNLTIIENRKNLGFAAGNNQGIKKSDGRHILLLNSDTEIKDNVIGEMVSWMDKNSKVGIATCALKNEDGTLQGSGGYFPNLLRVFAWMLFLEDIPLIDRLIKPYHPMHSASPIYKGSEFFKTSHQQDWVTGAFFLIRKDVIEQIGYFDEDYFMYVEEVDFCFRAKTKGWQVYYLPDWSITHLGGASGTSELPILSEFKSLKRFYKKFYPSWQFPFLRLLLAAGALVRIPLFYILKGRERSAIYVKAFRET